MNHIEAVVVLALLLSEKDEADKLKAFMIQFPDHKEVAKERWRDAMRVDWEE